MVIGNIKFEAVALNRPRRIRVFAHIERYDMKKISFALTALTLGAAGAANAADSLFTGLVDSASAIAGQTKSSSISVATVFMAVVVVLVGIGLLWRFLSKKS